MYFILRTAVEQKKSKETKDFHLQDNQSRMIARISASHRYGEWEEFPRFSASSCLRLLCALLCSCEVLFLVHGTQARARANSFRVPLIDAVHMPNTMFYVPITVKPKSGSSETADHG